MDIQPKDNNFLNKLFEKKSLILDDISIFAYLRFSKNTFL